MDLSWLTQEYLYSIGYYKITDDGKYGVYKSLHQVAVSRTYGPIPKDYRKISFNRDSKCGVFMGVSADWGTRYCVNNVLVINQQEFETVLNSCV